MRRMQAGIGVFALAGLLAFGPTVTPAAAQQQEEQEDPTVDLVLATGVEAGEPVGEAESFPADVGQIFAWLDVDGAQGEVLEVVWSHGDEQSIEQVMIREDPGQEWTAMQIPAEATGSWTVEIRHGGSVLTSSTFTVGQ